MTAFPLFSGACIRIASARGALLSLAVLALADGLVGQAGPVAVASAADPTYVQRKFGANGADLRPESFVVAQGSFFGGLLADPSLEKTTFSGIASALTPALARQRIYPARDKANADLLIVVHWGITRVEEDPTHGQQDWQRLEGAVGAYNSTLAKSGSADPGEVLANLGFLRAKSSFAGGQPAANAVLLGYSADLNRAEQKSLAHAAGMSELDRRLRSDLVDERYFVILMAYDLSTLRTARRGAKSRLLWSTHMSIRAIGRDFTTALPVMGQAAARFLGRSSEGLVLDAAAVPEGRVEVGEPSAVPETHH